MTCLYVAPHRRVVKLPNGDRAVVDIRKIRDYSLNPDHPGGGHKARVFRAVLGLGRENATTVAATLLELAATSDVVAGSIDSWGARIYWISKNGRAGRRRHGPERLDSADGERFTVSIELLRAKTWEAKRA